MADQELDQIDVKGDGRIILYKREGLKKPKWQARIRVPNATGYKIVTTKTADLDEAKRFAVNLYEELYMQVKAGGSLQTKTFRQVHKEWQTQAAVMGKTRRDGSWDETIERIDSYALEFFGSKRIDMIKEADFTEYWAWRKSNYRKKQPTNGTLKRERTSIMPVFKFALSKGYITKIPETNTPIAKTDRRPTFTTAEWDRIFASTKSWVKEAKELATWRDRFMAQHCFVILAFTGLRIGELRKLRWRDLKSIKPKGKGDKAGSYLVGHVRGGKTGSREFIFHPGAEVCVKLVYIQRCKELAAQNPDNEDAKPDPEEVIFCHPNGKPIMEYKNSFRSLLAFAGVPIELDGKPRTIYSLRHWYATWRLTKETNPFLLAKQMGTSVEILEKHYGQVVTATVAAEITKAAPSQIEVNSDIEFPF